MGWRTQTRRTFVKVLGSSVVGLAGCGGPAEVLRGNARLTARPGTPATQTAPGTHPLGLGTANRDGLLLVPASYDPATPTPLLLSLHGAGGSGQRSIDAFGPYAEAVGVRAAGAGLARSDVGRDHRDVRGGRAIRGRRAGPRLRAL